MYWTGCSFADIPRLLMLLNSIKRKYEKEKKESNTWIVCYIIVISNLSIR